MRKLLAGIAFATLLVASSARAQDWILTRESVVLGSGESYVNPVRLWTILGVSNAGVASPANFRPDGTTVTWTRNSAQAYTDDAGLVQTADANTPGCNSSGCYPWQGFIETLLQTNTSLTEAGSPDTVTAPWVLVNVGIAAPVANIESVTDPTGAISNQSRFDFAASNAATQESELRQSFTGTAASWTLSTYAKTISGTGTLNIGLTSGAAGTWTACALTTAWSRCSVTRTLTAATWYVIIGPDTTAAHWADTSNQPTTQAALSAHIWNPNATATSVAMPPTTAVAGAVTVPANVATTTAPSVNSFRWCRGFKGTMSNWTPAGGLYQALWSAGGHFSANSQTLFAVSGVLMTWFGDEAGNPQRYSYTHGFANNSQHDVIVCSGNPPRMAVDDAEVALTLTVAGTGEGVPQPTTYLGQTVSGFNSAGVAIKALKFCPYATNPMECRP